MKIFKPMSKADVLILMRGKVIHRPNCSFGFDYAQSSGLLLKNGDVTQFAIAGGMTAARSRNGAPRNFLKGLHVPVGDDRALYRSAVSCVFITRPLPEKSQLQLRMSLTTSHKFFRDKSSAAAQ